MILHKGQRYGLDWAGRNRVCTQTPQKTERERETQKQSFQIFDKTCTLLRRNGLIGLELKNKIKHKVKRNRSRQTVYSLYSNIGPLERGLWLANEKIRNY